MRLRRVVPLLLATAVLAACSLFTDLGGLDGDEPTRAETDGGTSTADEDAPSSPATDAGVTVGDAGGGSDADVAGNALTNPGFESGGIACSPGWRTFQSTATPSEDARTGAWSCLVCNGRGDYVDFGIYGPTVATTAPSRWVLQGWVRKHAMHPNPQLSLLEAVVEHPDGGVDVIGPVDTFPAGDWTMLQMVADTLPGDGITLIIGGRGEPGTCVLVDDVVFVEVGR